MGKKLRLKILATFLSLSAWLGQGKAENVKENRVGTIPILAHYLQVKNGFAAKAYDQVVRPAMTQDGTISQEL